MIVEDRSMSYQPDTKHLMAELLRADADAWASLQGLMAVLALPPIHCRDGSQRRRRVEVEITPGVWQVVDSIAIGPQVIQFWFGTNGSRTEYTFLRTEATLAPRWRIEQQDAGVLAP